MVIGAAILVGRLLNLRRINPIVALVYTAVINGVAAVPLLVLILLVANKRAIVGAHVNGVSRIAIACVRRLSWKRR